MLIISNFNGSNSKTTTHFWWQDFEIARIISHPSLLSNYPIVSRFRRYRISFSLLQLDTLHPRETSSVSQSHSSLPTLHCPEFSASDKVDEWNRLQRSSYLLEVGLHLHPFRGQIAREKLTRLRKIGYQIWNLVIFGNALNSAFALIISMKYDHRGCAEFEFWKRKSESNWIFSTISNRNETFPELGIRILHTRDHCC